MNLKETSGYTQHMTDVRTARKHLQTALDLLHDPIPEHHLDVRYDLLEAFQTLTSLAHIKKETPHKVTVYQDFRLNSAWARERIEEALLCLEDLGQSSRVRVQKMLTAAEYVQDAYLLI